MKYYYYIIGTTSNSEPDKNNVIYSTNNGIKIVNIDIYVIII